MIALTLRKLTAGMTATATGKKLILLNALVGGTAGGGASFCNTFFMRRAEIEKGITVYEDANTEKEVGISKICANSAVVETALSRSVMSMSSCAIPAGLILGFSAIGFSPTGKIVKTSFDVWCIILALGLGLPLSIAVFPPVSLKRGADLEQEFHKYEDIYFNKGL